MPEDIHVNTQTSLHPQDSHRPSSQPSGNIEAQKVNQKHPTVSPLAPLEYLQNQRRGSITDPSLHATPNPNPISSRPRQGSSATFQASVPTSHTTSGSNNKQTSLDHRPTSPFVFGGPLPHSMDS